MKPEHQKQEREASSSPSPESADTSAVQRRAADYARGQDRLAPDAQPGYAEQQAELSPVQARGQTRGDVHRLADEGTRGSGGALPYGDVIQESFGRHDISHVRAYTDSSASAASEAMGAEAFATGSSIAFGTTPSLHTAAHEAAHVVQQRAGVSLQGGVGQSGDAYERHADEVADLVVQGRSAETTLDRMSGNAASTGVQMRHARTTDEQVGSLPKKGVSGKAAGRLEHAKKAIEHTKALLNFGAGNQVEALRDSKFNSNYRLSVMRDWKCWIIAPQVRALAAANREALTAAKAALAHGGNCGEHAQVAFDYLRVHAVGEPINRTDVEGLDHAFILMGDMSADKDDELVVSDPWPTKAKACLWEDHFAWEADRGKINTRNSMVADGKNISTVIQAGLKLSPRGEAMIKMALSQERTEEEITKGQEGDKPWIWDHSDAHSSFREYNYQPADE